MEPRPVFLLDHGRHSSLVLGRADDTLVRCCYGHWNWYVLDRQGPVRAAGALPGVDEAGIGRRSLSGPPSAEAVRDQVPVPIIDMWRLEFDAGRVRELDRRLTGLF